MTLTIDLTPEQEERLHREAQGRGVNADALFREMLDRTLAQIEDTRPKKQRVLGLHAGQWWVADDFDDPLLDSFWLGEGITPFVPWRVRRHCRNIQSA